MTGTLTRDEIANRLAEVGYIADQDLATALLLMDMLQRPLLIEGEAGVGKTEVAKALAEVRRTNLIRLQCYEGLDQSAALYEWNYQRQLLAIKAREGGMPTRSRRPSSPSATCWPGPCWRRSAKIPPRCC